MKHDIIIVGAGLAGMSLALALAGQRRSVLLLDAKPAPAIAVAADYDQRIYAVSPAGAAWLKQVRAWQALDAARITPVYDMHIQGGEEKFVPPLPPPLSSPGGAGLHLSAYRAGIGELCTIVEEREMMRVLQDAVGYAPGVELLRPVEPASLQTGADAVLLTLADGRAFEAQLIAAADGARSWVRGAAGIATDDIPYGQTAVAANFHTEKPHFNSASQWFRDEPAIGSSSILAWLPLPGQQISIVWSAPDALASELMAMPPDALAHRVAEAGGNALGALRPAGVPASFPLRNQRAGSLIAPRVALVGDAAHVVHPLAGQGLNLGFGDCAELARVLDGALDPGAHLTLRRYERARKAAILELHGLTHGLQRLFSSQAPLVRTLRNAGLNFTGRLPVIPELLVRLATRTL